MSHTIDSLAYSSKGRLLHSITLAPPHHVGAHCANITQQMCRVKRGSRGLSVVQMNLNSVIAFLQGFIKGAFVFSAVDVCDGTLLAT